MRDFNITIPAGGSQGLSRPVRYLFLESSNGRIRATWRGGAYTVPMEAGVGPINVSDSDGNPAKDLELENPNGFDIQAVVVLGMEDGYRANVATAVLSAPDALATAADPSISAGSTELVLPANSKRSRARIRAASGNGTAVRVGDSNAAAGQGLRLEPDEEVSIRTKGDIYAHNPNTSAAAFSVMEETD